MIREEAEKALREFSQNPDGFKANDEMITCRRINIDDFVLVIVFDIRDDVIKIITAYFTNDPKTIKKRCKMQ